MDYFEEFLRNVHNFTLLCLVQLVSNKFNGLLFLGIMVILTSFPLCSDNNFKIIVMFAFTYLLDRVE